MWPWGGMPGSHSPSWGELGVLATSGLEELRVMLVVTPSPKLSVMGLSEEEQGEGSREGLCLALPQLTGQTQGAPSTQPTPGHPQPHQVSGTRSVAGTEEWDRRDGGGCAST